MGVPFANQYAEIAGRRRSSIAETPFSVSLLALFFAKRTVVLQAQFRQITKRIVLEHGVPVECTSNLAHETFHRFLATTGVVTEDVAVRGFEEAVRRGVPVGDVLVERKWLSSSDLFRALQQSLAKKLLDLFSWQDGELTVQDSPPHIESPLVVKVPQLVVMGVTRMSPMAEVEKGLSSWGTSRVVLDPAQHSLLNELKLGTQQMAIAERFRSPVEVGTVVSTKSSGAEARRLVYALGLLRILAPERVVATVTAPDTEPDLNLSGTYRALSGRPQAPIDTAAKEELYRAYLAHRRQDAFELLHLGTDAGLRQIEERYLEYARRFYPDKFATGEGREMYEKAKELFFAGARAYAQLVDIDARAALIKKKAQVRSETLRRHEVRIEYESSLLDPTEHFRKGSALRDTGDLVGALQQFELASDCDPQNGTYRAEAARCRYQLAGGSNATLVLEELSEAQRIDPNCGVAHLYVGEIHRKLKSWEKAEAALRRAAKLLAPDRRPLDALHALVIERDR